MCSFEGTCKKLGPVAQLVRAPPCHGGGQGFEPLSGRLLNNFQLQLNIWGLSSAGRASALQAEGHRFEPYRPHLNGWIPEWPKGTDCKSAATCFGGSNPPPSIELHKKLCRSGGTGRRPGLKIPWVAIPVPVRFRSAALGECASNSYKSRVWSIFLFLKFCTKLYSL